MTDNRRPVRKRLYWGAALALLAVLSGFIASRLLWPTLDVRGTATECEVHHLPLREAVVAISYGEPVLGRRYAQAKAKLFPHANTEHLGGCEPLRPQKARVLYCPKCREAFKEWLRRTPPGQR